jgi:phospholipid transport system transporter-binding protein
VAISEPATLEQKDGRVFVRGSITLENVRSLLERDDALLDARELLVDFSGLSAADSAAVALMLAWTRAAAARGARIVFENCPASLRTLAALYDVGDFIACR